MYFFFNFKQASHTAELFNGTAFDLTKHSYFNNKTISLKGFTMENLVELFKKAYGL